MSSEDIIVSRSLQQNTQGKEQESSYSDQNSESLIEQRTKKIDFQEEELEKQQKQNEKLEDQTQDNQFLQSQYNQAIQQENNQTKDQQSQKELNTQISSPINSAQTKTRASKVLPMNSDNYSIYMNDSLLQDYSLINDSQIEDIFEIKFK